MTRKCSVRWLAILKQLEQGLLVITASNRQADFLQQQYRYYQKQKDKSQQQKVWHKPFILTEKKWLSALFQHLMIHHGEQERAWTLLSDQESRLLWQQIILEDDDHLLDTRRTAERVRQAANKIAQWLLTDSISDDDSFNWREETRRFKGWQQKTAQQCEANSWLEPYQLNEWLTTRLHLLLKDNHCHLLPEKIGILGFQQLSPAQEQLFNHLKDSAIDLLSLSPESINPEVYRLELANNQEEIKQAAVWAKKCWSEDPELRIGIVLPKLNLHRELTRLTFERVFCPSEILKNNDQIHRPYDISLGLSLSSYPLIDSSIMLLDLLSLPIAQEELLLLLLSPFITSADQQANTITLNNLLRRSQQSHFTLNDLIFFSNQCEQENEPMQEMLEKLKLFDTRHALPPSQWAIQLAQLFEEIHWCEHRPLSSAEFQTKEAWIHKINQMALYDHLSGNINWSKFRSLLRRQLHETLFQPQTADCPIQIMGVLEAAFLTFDKIRICGIDNNLWPDSARPNPFLPFELQQQHDMPNATAERELRISKQLLELLSNAAEQVIFSHGKGQGDETLSVSPLLEDVELRHFQTSNMDKTPAQLINLKDKIIECIDDDFAPAINSSTVKGGSKLLQDIARCPFRAFAHHRLFATAPEQPREGLDPLDRGNLVHKVLEYCWSDLFDKQQSTLQTLYSENSLDAAIEPYIEKALEQLQKQRHTPLTQVIINIEQQRLKKLLLKWFEMETSRPPFTVKQVEQTVEAAIGDSIIRVQLDRVDQLEDGSLAVIDYKTGTVHRKNWFGERPDEPQLPLYAMVLSDQQNSIGALLYGQVQTAECRFIGVADDHTKVSGVSKDFQNDKLKTEAESLSEQVIQWRGDLQQLMEEYLAGGSAVTPRDEHVCRYCDLHGLCRIEEISQ